MTKAKISYTFGFLIFIELFYAYFKLQTITNFDISLKLKDIPKKLLLNQKNFVLRGAISFIPPIILKNDAIGHYVSYCWREYSDTWEQYDDLQHALRLVRPNTLISHCQLLIYTE